ncbi:DnaA N-terminal domain-containing protein [Neobacillus sp. WH10]|uniref:DnaA N-terminal domain-containing protein n=1 Tax=Neobacillus sp. WH10 TaxID=3047873 RepID=UPI0024C16BBE|nr:DnaA N-terminal domain-containing protein [Neobacillus sp. WH10]WHY79971.1 DnaA N-terminal domain-containing protein [Neobacillus sp. WH10]
MDLWIEVLKKISEKISKPSFETWFVGTEVEIDNDILFVKAKNIFNADWLEERYKSLISETVRELTEKTYEIKFPSIDVSLEKETTAIQSHSQRTSYHELKNLIQEQGALITKQQEKIEELEKRIHVLEQEDTHK